MQGMQFHDLKAEQMGDGTVRLAQIDHSGNEYIIDAHPAQILHIARALRGDGNRWPPNFAARLWRVRNRVADLAEMLDMVPSFPPSHEETPDVIEAHAVLQALDDFLDDFEIPAEP